MTRSGWVKMASTPEKIAVRKIERKAGNLMMLNAISSTSGNRQMREMLNASASVARAASISAVDAATSAVRLMRKKITRLRRMEGTTVAAMARICWAVVTPPTKLGTRMVVSESGDILSPK